MFKLADFGFSKTIDNDEDIMQSVQGTPLYMSPEIHQKKRYTAKADIFSMGVMLYQVYFKENPWSHYPAKGEGHIKGRKRGA